MAESPSRGSAAFESESPSPESTSPEAPRRFPFSAVLGQDDARLALLLAAVDPGIGGVLLRGDKGSAKSTLARGLAALLPGAAPFVELPLGASEDRVVGSLDVSAALAGGEVRFRPGLLADAHGGVLYVDEVNLLSDHLVDVLLDAAASGEHRVERDGISHAHPSRFVLVGSMNPEEGELRPQLLDRFGLAVDVQAPMDPALRGAIVRQRLAFDRRDAVTMAAANDADLELAARVAAASPAEVPDATIDFACRLALAVGAEGLRADLVLCRAAAALAAWEGRSEASADDVERVAPFALAHRRRRRPFDPPQLSPEELQDAIDQAREPDPPAADSPAAEPPPADSQAEDPRAEDRSDDPAPPVPPGDNGAGDRGNDRIEGRWGDLAGGALQDRPASLSVGARAGGPVVRGPDVRGPVVGERVPAGAGEPRGVAVAASIRAGLQRRAMAGDTNGAVVTAADLREPVRQRTATRCVILTVDTSGSMGSRARIEAATGAVIGLLADAYRSRHQVALVAFRGSAGDIALPPTASVEVARARLADLPTGGATPLAEGLVESRRVAHRVKAKGHEPFVVVITDARATSGPNAVDRALEIGAQMATEGIAGVVLDAEDHDIRLGLATRLADALAVPCIPLTHLSADAVERAIRTAMEVRP